MALTRESLNQPVEDIINRIRDILKTGRVTIGEQKPGEAWQYGGSDLDREISALNDELKKKQHMVSYI